LPLWLGAYLFSLLVLVFTFQWLKPRLKPGLVRLDDKVRARALRWRYRDPVQAKRERVALTWFFRFWTNFASAPALSCFAILLPMVAIAKMATQVQPGMIISGVPEFAFFRVGANTYIAPTLYFLPGLSYFGAMLLSFAKKRVFKRVRPPRPAGAFGHKMKDGSFPSGHSLTAICFWVMLGVVIGQSLYRAQPHLHGGSLPLGCAGRVRYRALLARDQLYRALSGTLKHPLPPAASFTVSYHFDPQIHADLHRLRSGRPGRAEVLRGGLCPENPTLSTLKILSKTSES